MHLLHHLLLHHMILCVVELLRETWREGHLLGFAQIVMSYAVNVHLIELLRLLGLNTLVVRR